MCFAGHAGGGACDDGGSHRYSGSSAAAVCSRRGGRVDCSRIARAVKQGLYDCTSGASLRYLHLWCLFGPAGGGACEAGGSRRNSGSSAAAACRRGGHVDCSRVVSKCLCDCASWKSVARACMQEVENASPNTDSETHKTCRRLCESICVVCKYCVRLVFAAGGQGGQALQEGV